MEKFAVGSIVLVTFPFSNLQGKKLRPALVLAHSEFANLILCQITSRPYASKTAIRLEATDFSSGGLPLTSYIRPDKIFTADRAIIKSSVGTINAKTKKLTLTRVRKLFS